VVGVRRLAQWAALDRAIQRIGPIPGSATFSGTRGLVKARGTVDGHRRTSALMGSM
jgi:hypothetical protein